MLRRCRSPPPRAVGSSARPGIYRGAHSACRSRHPEAPAGSRNRIAGGRLSVAYGTLATDVARAFSRPRARGGPARCHAAAADVGEDAVVTLTRALLAVRGAGVG